MNLKSIKYVALSALFVLPLAQMQATTESKEGRLSRLIKSRSFKVAAGAGALVLVAGTAWMVKSKLNTSSSTDEVGRELNIQHHDQAATMVGNKIIEFRNEWLALSQEDRASMDEPAYIDKRLKETPFPNPYVDQTYYDVQERVTKYLERQK